VTPEKLIEYGYEHPRQLPTGEWAAINMANWRERIFVWPAGEWKEIDRPRHFATIVTSFDDVGHRTSYHYPNEVAAQQALLLWDGTGDPEGPCVKVIVERSNPRIGDDFANHVAAPTGAVTGEVLGHD